MQWKMMRMMDKYYMFIMIIDAGHDKGVYLMKFCVTSTLFFKI